MIEDRNLRMMELVKPYRIIFMDLNMPEMNGLETTLKLKEMHKKGLIDLSQTKIILYSCLSNTSDLP